MFAYCNNNPINYTDSNGNFPWLIAFAAFVGAGVNIVLALMNNKSPAEVLLSGILGAATSGMAAAFPNLALLFTGCNLFSQLLDCVYSGYSFEETLAIMGLSALVELSFPETGDNLTDTLVDATFGTAKEVLSEAGIIIIGENSSGKLTVNNISTATSGKPVGSSGKGYMLMYAADTVKGDLLWI